MSPKMIDVLIFIPVIPALPVIATWFLPWEQWIPKRIPKSIVGPYLLYCSFAAWHFRGSWWVILLVAAGGIVVSAMGVSDVWKAKRLKQARDWPAVEGSVVDVGESRDAWGVKVTLIYTYRFQEKLYVGSQSFVFRKDEDAARFKERCKEPVVRVHYHPDKPDESALALERTP
jgi:hypothetical protein